LHWIFHPALQSGPVVAGLVLCFYLFFSLNSEARQAGLPLEKHQQAHAACLEETRRAMEEARSEFRPLEKQAGVQVEPRRRSPA